MDTLIKRYLVSRLGLLATKLAEAAELARSIDKSSYLFSMGTVSNTLNEVSIGGDELSAAIDAEIKGLT